MKFEVGTHTIRKPFNCLKCAERFYDKLGSSKKYLRDVWNNKIIKNTYGWE